MSKYKIYTLFWGFRDTPGNRGGEAFKKPFSTAHPGQDCSWAGVYPSCYRAKDLRIYRVFIVFPAHVFS